MKRCSAKTKKTRRTNSPPFTIMKVICENCGEQGRKWERRLLNNFDMDKDPKATMKFIEKIAGSTCKYCNGKLHVEEGKYTNTSDKPITGKEWLKVGKKLKGVNKQIKKELKDA